VALTRWKPHATLFHPHVDHHGDGPLHQPTANRIALILPFLVVADPIALGLQLLDGVLQDAIPILV
jgi:hypothetical protein